jgi:putative nucleotidyltransferase with HDIG domain
MRRKAAVLRKPRKPGSHPRTEHFIRGILSARGRKQAAQLVAVECKRLLGAQHAWILMLPQGGFKPFVLNAPPGIYAPAAIPAGLIQYVADTQRTLLCDFRRRQPFFLLQEKEGCLRPLASTPELEERRQKDLAWLGTAYAKTAFIILSLNTPLEQVRDSHTVAAKILIVKARAWKAEVLKKFAAFIPLARMSLAMTEQKKFLEKRLRQATAISEIAQNINATMDIDILMRLILLEVTKAMQCQGGDIWLKNDKESGLSFYSSLGLSTSQRGQLPAGELSKQALLNGEPLWIDNAANDPHLNQEILSQGNIFSLAVVPLKAKNKPIGVMHLFSKHRRAFSTEERILIKTLMNQAAAAIDNARLFEETKRRAQELLALYEIAQVISEMSNLNYALTHIVERVSEVLNVEKSWFMFYEKEEHALAAHPAAIGIDEEQIAALRVDCDAPGVSSQVFRSASPVFTNTAEQESLVQEEFKGVFQLRNLMAVPLRGQEQTLGVFLVANKRDQSHFAGNDVRLFRTLASEATVIIQNANLYDKLKRSYHSIVQIVSDMVDAREPYTAGHSKRVSAYSAIIAKQMKLPGEEIERIKMAGLLHDIGKIGVSENILLKPGKLSAAEFEAVKRHSEIAVQILKQVEFPWEIKTLIMHHHERYDGQGYPAGLKGEDTPLGSRIIAVSDAFDVITSARTYHKAKTPWDAFRVIIKNSGTQFDPAVVEAFEQAWPKLSEEIENNEQLLLEG